MLCMETKKDARKLSREVLEEKRRQSHQLRKRGMKRAEIGLIVGAISGKTTPAIVSSFAFYPYRLTRL